MSLPELVCPDHQAPLARDGNTLRCKGGESFEIVGGVPRFVKGETYADAFGAQWNEFRTTQLDSHSGLRISRERLRRALGEGLFRRLSGMRVLECGCGAGRFTEVLLAEGAHVVSIDLSSAVDANVSNCPVGPSHLVAQADLRRLPFAPRSFDLVLCIGVIQHTPSSTATIAALYEHVRPGGWLVIDHYGDRLRWYTRTAPLARQVALRLPPDRKLKFTKKLVDAFLPLHARTRSRFVRRLLVRVSPIISYHGHLELSDKAQREWALLDTHDSLTDHYKHFMTAKAMRREMESLGMEIERVADVGGLAEGRGRRPERA